MTCCCMLLSCLQGLCTGLCVLKGCCIGFHLRSCGVSFSFCFSLASFFFLLFFPLSVFLCSSLGFRRCKSSLFCSLSGELLLSCRLLCLSTLFCLFCLCFFLCLLSCKRFFSLLFAGDLCLFCGFLGRFGCLLGFPRFLFSLCSKFSVLFFCCRCFCFCLCGRCCGSPLRCRLGLSICGCLCCLIWNM